MKVMSIPTITERHKQLTRPHFARIGRDPVNLDIGTDNVAA